MADKTAQPDRPPVRWDEKRGGYGSGDTPAT
jgi:hypothetical protein